MEEQSTFLKVPWLGNKLKKNFYPLFRSITEYLNIYNCCGIFPSMTVFLSLFLRCRRYVIQSELAMKLELSLHLLLLS